MNIDKNTLLNYDKSHLWHHLTQHKVFEDNDPLVIVKGEGMFVTDINEKTYLDATSGGVWTVNVGYGREEIAQVIKEQLVQMPYFAGTVGTVPSIKYAQELIELLPGLNRVYYSNSGSEANEKAYKLVRQRSIFYNGGKKHKVIYRDRDYHGTTITTLSSSGQAQRKENYGPFTPGFTQMPHCCCYRCPFGKTYNSCNIECARSLEDIIQQEGPDNVGSVVLEPITAGGGVIEPVKEYYPIIQEICKKYDVLIHIDEVVCGLGRTGEWFGYQNFNLKPDIVTSAKGLASGYAAISITVAAEEVFNLFKNSSDDTLGYFRDISTFGGCTAGPSAALSVIDIIKKEKLLDNVRVVGKYFLDKLYELKEKHAIIGDVRGKGFLLGLELVKDQISKEPLEEKILATIVANCFKEGIMIGRTNRSFEKYNNVIIFSPSFICTKGNVDEILKTVDKVFGNIKI